MSEQEQIRNEREKGTRTIGIVLILLMLFSGAGTLITWSVIIDIKDYQELILDILLDQLQSQIPKDELGLTLELHVTMYHYRLGKLISTSHHAGTLTNVGKDWIEGKLSAENFSNSSKESSFIALSNSTDSPSATWHEIPDEITTGNMARANGTYVSTGVGAWNISNTFSPSETNSSRLVGLYWDSGVTKSLVASDTITVINYASGDTVQIVWQISVS